MSMFAPTTLLPSYSDRPRLDTCVVIDVKKYGHDFVNHVCPRGELGKRDCNASLDRKVMKSGGAADK